jgi:hypothetical protein
MSEATAPEMKNITPPQVCLILGLALILAGSVVWLAALGEDIGSTFAALAAVAITIAGAFGYAKANQLTRNMDQVNQNVDHVRELSNGRLSEVMDQNKKLQEQVTALAILVRPDDSNGTK